MALFQLKSGLTTKILLRASVKQI